MRKVIIPIMCCSLLMASTSSCGLAEWAVMNDPDANMSTKGAVVGAVSGANTGAFIGSLTGHSYHSSRDNSLIGAAIGAVAGAAIGAAVLGAVLIALLFFREQVGHRLFPCCEIRR